MGKHLRKLLNRHKQLLTANGYNAKDYLYERDTTEKTVFVNPNTKEELVFIKKEGLFQC